MGMMIGGGGRKRGIVQGPPPTPDAGIASVSGTIAQGNTITISGGEFGAGCSTIFYEDFSDPSLSVGAALAPSNTIFDNCQTTYIPRAVSISRSGSYGMDSYVVCNDDAAKFGQATCDISFGGDYTEAFVSLALINPTGKHMPGAGVGLAANTHASGSHAKFPWLQGNDEAGNSSYHDNDIVIPNLNGGKFSLIGNGGGTIKDGLGGTNPTWWTFGEWNRMTTWLKAGADPDMDSGQTYFEGMSHTGGKFVYSSSTVSIFGVSLNRVSCTNGSAFLVGETVTGGTSGATGVVKSTNASYLNLQHGGSMDSATPVKFIIGETITGGTSLAVGTTTTNAYGEAHQHSSKHSWPQINLPGYYRPIDSTSSATYPHGANTQIVFDDFYVAVGANSAARVELGNASTYAACTKLALCDYSAWSNTSITAKARCADINLGADVWLFVTLADNTTQYTYKVL